MAKVKKCVICDERPAFSGSPYCHNCNAQLEADKRRRGNGKPFKFATYRGQTIAFYQIGNGKLRYSLVQRKPESLPKRDTLDLNTYIHGFEREQVKRIKSAILAAANAA
jgi:hypothetical protein